MILHDLFLPESLSQEIIKFCFNDGKIHFRNNSYGSSRKFCNLNQIDVELKYKVKNFSKLCYLKIFGVDVIDEPKFGNFISVHTENGFVHAHRDVSEVENFSHVRINFLVQKPIEGGIPIINGTELQIEESGCWLNLASRYIHSSTPVVGEKERVVLSLGSYINDKVIMRTTT
jgi:hypothetical protein